MMLLNTEKRGQKKGQITPFIIIGLVLLIIIAAIVNINYIYRTSPIQLKGEEMSGPKLTGIISRYVEGCINKEAVEPIIRIGMQGGDLWPQQPNFLYYYGTKVSYLCYVEGLDPSWDCVNSMLTKQKMEFQLSRELERRLKKCIDLSEFKIFADNVNAGELKVNVTIAKDDVVVFVKYPINMTYEDYSISISDFSSKLNYPLGRLYLLSQDIVNEEIELGSFNIEKFVREKGMDVVIERHRPYPDIVYILKRENYTFQFALQGLPAVGQFIGEKKNYYGCCINRYDDLCFKNVNPLTCVELGDYNPNVNCRCIGSYQVEEGCKNNCLDCANGKKHGESWCIYDSVTGLGRDYVGSRHYKQICLNGTIITEECRDYREELCTESVIDGKTEAKCRINRWYTCFDCDTKTCCDDTRHRDCYWDNTLTTEKKCVPQVPPGLRFWLNEGTEICLRGNMQKECEGFSCEQKWLDDAARFCYSQGDCGNYKNIIGKLSKGGFYETDVLKNVDDSIYDIPNNISKLNLTFNSEQQRILEKSKERFDYISSFISSAFSFFDSISRLDLATFLNPFSPGNRPKVRDFTLCGVWVSPLSKADCGFCSSNPLLPCTEYRCKSISERCEFQMKEGVPECKESYFFDSRAPKVNVDVSSFEGLAFKKETLAGNEGYAIIDPLRPHKTLRIKVKTDEDSRCSVSLTPRIAEYSLQTVLIGDAMFKKEHEIYIRIPPRFVIPQKIWDVIN
ncbi:MAG: hypothetical protein N3D84_01500, partial [Candidatus Woesearchaeota archaeon]|nr:hypothetical protein [Candidatus Woesearchaeota archaeon]